MNTQELGDELIKVYHKAGTKEKALCVECTIMITSEEKNKYKGHCHHCDSEINHAKR